MTGRLEFRPHEGGIIITRNGEHQGAITPKRKGRDDPYRGNHLLIIPNYQPEPHQTIAAAKKAARYILGD